MKSIFSKAVIAAVVAASFTLSAQGAVHGLPADTGKMAKMGKMDKKTDKKMDKKMNKKMDKMNKGKMAKDSTKM